ncbi:ZYRO0F08646p [Zygosaccharomyces rouxii]|uniref:ZYRO0F08646p n=1 Tax=Zygosaccharomyces rouxii (strain ATCC 2623 / CBS 732 / NBRC 1130 / NCYC 568 / NRRL Y-229) TaxID=559307 RepID=C5DXY0_ZYGRC|nr:uncharacterized protein ZYRO0F08646g [Zygosaccharomyces rouxii]CAR28641.1 ZYRO0F08646p [Zygosaccharomyces rouxii]
MLKRNAKFTKLTLTTTNSSNKNEEGMDWAIQAAKKKNKRLPGGSRSIIETLNVFNDVVTDGDLEINRILNGTRKWVNDIGNGLQGQLSPEKTVKIGDETIVNDIPEEKTPERSVNLPSATPKSLAEESAPEPEPEREPEPEPEPAPLPQVQQERFTRRRTTTRRSNVFVPLPSKDPLVVQPAPPPVPPAEPAAMPPAASLLPPAIPPTSIQSSTALSSPASTASPTASVPSANTASHRRRRAIATASTANKSNVFDRLSSIPTKSFENKVNRTARKGSSASSIDVTGSPMRRSSPRRNPGAVVDSSIQETLKSIFSTQPSGSKSSGKVTKREPPVPHLARSFNRRANFKPSAAKSLARDPSPPRPISQHASQQQQQQQEANVPQPARQKYDRLTKFQLLPPVESEKDDLKKKLNKRLSEVVRTQQEQHRRKQEQQKRKSHLEEDFKRRTKLWSDTATTTTNTNKTAVPNPLQQLDKNNTILHDLYLADHRTILGENTATTGTGSGSGTGGTTGAGNYDGYANQSLPYIHSDSDEEDDVALAPWARSPYLQRQLQLQQNWDPRKIFGPIPPLHIDQIFQHSRLNRLKPKRG